MKRLPEHVKHGINSRYHIIWWGRRAVFEVVEEISQDIFKVSIAVNLANLLAPVAEWLLGIFIPNYSLDPYNYWSAITVLCIVLAHNSIFEIMRWKNEVYVVVRDQSSGNGRVYKFYGWLNRRMIDEPITERSPSVIQDQSFWQRQWKAITGEDMCRVTLKSQNHGAFLDGRRISSKFVKAINEVSGPKPEVVETPSYQDLNTFDQLERGVQSELINLDDAREAAKTVLQRTIYGRN